MEEKKSKGVILVVILLMLIIGICVWLTLNKDKEESPSTYDVESSNEYQSYRIEGNSLQEFDLYFLGLENKEENKIYSPLSIKYALGMLSEGAKDETKEQIDNIIGTYEVKKYSNNSNMSFANALFIRDSFKDLVEENYVNTLVNKYGAEVIYDSFNDASTLNNWVSNKTFNLVNNLFDDVSDNDFILTNALAIDMEWVNKIQSEYEDYYAKNEHINYYCRVSGLSNSYYYNLEFEGLDNPVMSVAIGASINKYDIVSELGEDNIRKTVGDAYTEWLINSDCDTTNEPDVKTYLDSYIEELDSNYKDIGSSTDFSFYSDDNVKVFSKDLKEYNGMTLQYIGIMPKNDSLNTYISNLNVSEVNNIISNLKGIEYDNFEDGVITKITGYIPMFSFDYELDLMNDLNTLGINNIFNPSLSNISGITSVNGSYINKAIHKANIDFSNDGIKASAATIMGGKGGGGCYFEYYYDVPVNEIDLTFDRPYLFLIIDKTSKEVWFTGTVYEPTEYSYELIK